VLRPADWVRQRSRRAVYRRPDGGLVRLLPGGLRRGAPLPPRGERRVEVGSGFNPRPGYIHVDVVPGLPDLHLVARADRLPFADGWCDEILAVHMIEHVPAGALRTVLATWHRQLAPGGVLTLHTPNGTALASVLARSDEVPVEHIWAVQSAVYGYNRAPWDANSPDAVGMEPDHKLLFTFPLLSRVLTEAGFTDVADISGSDPHCHHTRDWAPYVPGLCLEVRAVKSPTQRQAPPSPSST